MKPRKQSDATKLRCVRRKIANCQLVIDSLREELKERRRTGWRMANLCFNGAQVKAVPDEFRGPMDDLHPEWDAIRCVKDDELYAKLFGRGQP